MIQTISSICLVIVSYKIEVAIHRNSNISIIGILKSACVVISETINKWTWNKKNTPAYKWMIFKYPLCTVENCPAILIAVAGFFPFDPCTCSCWNWRSLLLLLPENKQHLAATSIDYTASYYKGWGH